MKHHLLKSSLANSSLGISLCALLMFAALTFGQSTQPANLPLEDRANQAYDQGQYAKALPLLQKLAGTLIDTPEKLGAVEERIRICKTKIAADQKPHPVAAAPSTPAINFAATRKTFPAPYPGATIDLSIWDLGNFDYDNERGGPIPADVTQLSGCKVLTRGYMIPLDQAENIVEFALVTDLFDHPRPQVQRTIIVHLPQDKAISYSPDVLEVEGKLTVQEKKDQGYIVSIFDIDAISIKPAPQ